MNTLIIDTSNNKEIKVGIRIEGKERLLKQKINYQKAQVALPMIDELLKQQDLGLKDLTSIEVNTHPGSFTGIRVGMAIANALGFALKIPIKTI
ncbi:MAG: tRNA (adenosine(37)-N6)-threonylcarbamoyltransferase complex dimerization subunit type 1 TsaB [Candidatus Levybacteria bacterium RIFCSPHIGHO2_01_FULL_38_26]|nr:MAG: tRNA (adenosine(37)-N6)-threonylcarbamoyltransferase complex dimerization subunit type 1 TsaB [Candidatus Levybacteria bacterium RIFCSPHIGHO2_01_FULL_38_26]